MKKVIKRKGYEEEFDFEKIKVAIEKAAREAGEQQIFKVVEDVSRIAFEFCDNKDIIETQDIREVILNYLKDKYPHIYEAWIKYEKEIKNR